MKHAVWWSTLSLVAVSRIAFASPEAPQTEGRATTPADEARGGPNATISGLVGLGAAWGKWPAASEFAVEGRAWVGEHYGLGGRAGLLAFTTFLWPTHTYEALFLEPSLLGRVGSDSVTGYGGIGVGVADGNERRCVRDSEGWFGPCEAWSSDHALAFTGSVTLGIDIHPWRRGFTLGPQGRLQTVDGELLGATAGLSLGGSL